MRRLFPVNGRPYELFDTSFLLTILVALGYFFGASAAARAALDSELDFIPLWAFGIVPVVAGAVGMVTAYIPRLVEFGYAVAIGGALFVVVLYTISMVRDYDVKVLAQTFVYLWMARRLLREEISEELAYRAKCD